MSIEDKILKKIFEITPDILDKESVKFQGIAKSARDKKYDSLSDKQKRIISKLFTRTCNGSAHHQYSCGCILMGDSLLEAYNNYLMYDDLMCESCMSETDAYKRAIERSFKE